MLADSTLKLASTTNRPPPVTSVAFGVTVTPTMPLSPAFLTSASRLGTGIGHSVQSRPRVAGSTHTTTSVATVFAGRPGTVASVRTAGSMQTACREIKGLVVEKMSGWRRRH
ncbi:hypothetical protein HGRIS_000013 [Hohenbuehelia grisea]|uniref:Uncharacterized protein n=1 Tax=Hohenbuehelia grisea TaxID=104357 RepID=A0ABR3JPY8_9AGAR